MNTLVVVLRKWKIHSLSHAGELEVSLFENAEAFAHHQFNGHFNLPLGTQLKLNTSVLLQFEGCLSKLAVTEETRERCEILLFVPEFNGIEFDAQEVVRIRQCASNFFKSISIIDAFGLESGR